MATLVGVACAGAAMAQTVPARVHGEYAIGNCAVPDVTVIIDGAGVTVYQPGTSEVIASVVAVDARDTFGRIEMNVLVDGDEPGRMALVDLDGGAIEVQYTEDGGGEEPPQRIELCQAAVAGPVVEENPPVASDAVVPDILIGEYATGSCTAPEERLVIEASQLEAFDGPSGQSQGVARVVGVEQIPGAYLIDVDLDGDLASLELAVINQDILEAVFIAPNGNREDPETLYRCTEPVTTTGPIEPIDEIPMPPEIGMAAVPDAFLGRYVVGTDATCDLYDTEVVFEVDRLVVFEGGRQEVVIDVLEATIPPGAIEPGLDMVIAADDQEGLVEMRSTGGVRYALTFYDSVTGDADETETITLCDPAVPTTGTGPDSPVVSAGSSIPAAFLGRYVLGPDATCELFETEVIFEADRLIVSEDGEFSMAIDVLEATVIGGDLDISVQVEDDAGVIEMREQGPGTYRVTFTDTESGRAEESEIFILCDPVPDGPVSSGSSGDLGDFVFDQPVAAFDALMSELEAVCQPGSEQICLDAFWNFADVTGDGQLTQAELARVTRYGAKWAVAGYFTVRQFGAESTAAGPRMELGQQLAIHIGTMVTGPLVADGLIYNHDYDGDDALSQAELFPDGVESAPLALPALMALFTEDTLETLFDSLDELGDLM